MTTPQKYWYKAFFSNKMPFLTDEISFEKF